LSYAPARSRRT